MAESKIPVTPGTGLDLDSATVATGQGTVHREAVHLADPTDPSARAKVTDAAPASNVYGQVVRVVGGATEGKQDTGNASLASIDGKLPANAASEATLGLVTKEGTPITGQALESGGASVLGWLSSLRKAIAERLNGNLSGPATWRRALPRPEAGAGQGTAEGTG